ncbi:PRC-barrel domain-containing protein [Afifella sp. H1R]|uniref:PRC-barrel domain-containing protein n=1 Tax=Afifella sp. H1R TaxID=2908841 RepID=UPI001F210D5E|nr:PRC-barrel domain-containing protein [Afifella sp. H1R]MCF1503241.1 PRC-barrel domain-containing protein [Afifella sp. H1R]
MIRTLMASTAIAALLTTGAIAQTQPAPQNETTQAQSTTEGVKTQQKQGEDLASSWMGQTVYSSAGPDAEEVGDIDDLLVDENGNITAAIIGVGGFLGLGEKEVALDYDQFQVTQDQNGEMRLVVDATEEELKNAPEFQENDNQRSYAQMQKEGGNDSASSTDASATTASSAGAASGSMTKDQSQQTASSTTTTSDGAANNSAMSGQDRQTAFAQPEQGETRLSDWLGREVYSSATGQDATGAGSMGDKAGQRQQQAMQNNTDSGHASGSMGQNDTMASGEPVTDMQDRVKTDASGQTTAMGTSGTTSGDSTDQQMATNRSATGGSASGSDTGQNQELAANPDDQQQSVGEIDDVILADNGKIDSIVIDVGGFLGVGEKPVAIKFDKVEMTQASNEDEPRLTIPMTRAELENAPKWEMAGQEGDVASNTSDMNADTTGSQTAQNSQSETTKSGTNDNAGTGSMTTASRDQTDMGSSKSAAGGAQPSGLSADEIMGATVYGSNDESVGDIDDVIVGQNGDVRAVIIDVGGFLGIGEKPVAVEYDTLNIQKDANGETRYSINATENQLEDAPEYEGAQ